MNTDIQAQNAVELFATKTSLLSAEAKEELLNILETELAFAFQQGKIANQASMTVKLTNKEITDQIYDTLSGNGGMSEHHVNFNPDRITQGECNSNDGVIVFELDEQRNIQIVISDAPANYFTQE
jgi:hypothetical protein